MLTIENWQDLPINGRQNRLKRPFQDNNIEDSIRTIISVVRSKGDAALLQYTESFDGVILTSLLVPEKKILNAKVSRTVLSAITTAIETITIFHKSMLPQSKQVMTAEGIQLERIYRPLQKVGLYVPGGNNAPLVSSLLMQAIPAEIAGCPIRILCTPPNALGEINPTLLVAARLCKIDKIYSIGGAQAIAAMAYGTKTIPRVNKIFGSGNRYVTGAKLLVSLDPAGAAIDLPVGPSELMIIADDAADPAFVAADLLAQAEHGINSQVVLICDSLFFASAVNTAVLQQFTTLSRQTIIKQVLENSSIIVCNERHATLSIINEYAPEHLIINRKDANTWVNAISNAGTIFLGPWASETMGNYVSGSNQVLPTNGYASNHSGLSTDDFLKAITIQKIERRAQENLGRAAYTLAMVEGLDGHANAIKQRIPGDYPE